MIDALENNGRLMRILKGPEEIGRILNVKETWAKEDEIIYYKQNCDKNKMGPKPWRYASTMPEAYVRYRVRVISCTQMTKAEFYAKHGRCLRYNNGLWTYDGVNDHDSEWFRERQWQNEADASSKEKIFAVEYKLEKRFAF